MSLASTNRAGLVDRTVDPVTLEAMNQRLQSTAGGIETSPCRSVMRRDGRREELPSKILTRRNAGDIVHFYTTDGGGPGDPLARDPEKLLTDVLDGRVSVEAARRDYGVVLDVQDRCWDRSATEALRASLRRHRDGGIEGAR